MKPEHYNLDHYAALAKKKNYRSRASFKLLEMHNNLKLFKKDMKILDLGAAPGSWSQVAHELCGSNSIIFGIDILPIQPYKNIIFLKKDINHLKYDELLEIARANNLLSPQGANHSNKSTHTADSHATVSMQNTKDVSIKSIEDATATAHTPTSDLLQSAESVALSNSAMVHTSQSSSMQVPQSSIAHDTQKQTHSRLFFDLVLCDICPNKSGNAFVDSHNMHTVNINTINISAQALSKHGALIMKFFQDSYTPELKALLEKTFQIVKVIKPSASRSISSEMYYYAKHLRV